MMRGRLDLEIDAAKERAFDVRQPGDCENGFQGFRCSSQTRLKPCTTEAVLIDFRTCRPLNVCICAFSEPVLSDNKMSDSWGQE